MNTLTTSALTNISAANAPGGAGGGGGDVFSFIETLASNTQTAIGSILVVAGLILFLIIALRGKTVGAVIMGIVVGALVAGAGGIMLYLSGVFTQTFTTTAAPETVIVQQIEPGAESL